MKALSLIAALVLASPLALADTTSPTKAEKENFFQIVCVPGMVEKFSKPEELESNRHDIAAIHGLLANPELTIKALQEALNEPKSENLGEALGRDLALIFACGPAVILDEQIGNRECKDAEGISHSPHLAAKLCRPLLKKQKVNL